VDQLVASGVMVSPLLIEVRPREREQ
jgi:hypothetical protein